LTINSLLIDINIFGASRKDAQDNKIFDERDVKANIPAHTGRVNREITLRCVLGKILTRLRHFVNAQTRKAATEILGAPLRLGHLNTEVSMDQLG